MKELKTNARRYTPVQQVVFLFEIKKKNFLNSLILIASVCWGRHSWLQY